MVVGLIEFDNPASKSYICVVALIGGGINQQPGEISLAHNGVLFADSRTLMRLLLKGNLLMRFYSNILNRTDTSGMIIRMLLTYNQNNACRI